MEKKYKMGDKHPNDGNLLFWSYHKSVTNGEYWVTKETYLRWKGYDKYWSVYYLPKENYYGCTNRFEKRMKEHTKKGKNTEGVIIIKKFKTQKLALEYEEKMQLKHNANGYRFTEKWRKMSSERLLKNGYEWIYNKRKKPIICNETGQIFSGIRECERFFNKTSGNLSMHLKGHPQHKTFCKLTFKYYERN